MAEALKSKPLFTVEKNAPNGRLGAFSFSHAIRTPFLFPVALLMTGTTARGGATWKYILQAQDEKTQEHTLLRRNSPILSQVLHFLDYKISPNSLQNWRSKTIRGLYNEQIDRLDYQAPIFLDSGGYTLMWRTGLDLSKYGISLEPGQEAKSILQLQRDLGGDMIATLDYPLPPNLEPSEMLERTSRSMGNAIQAAELLRDDPDFKDYTPFLYMAVHGLTADAISTYVRDLFKKIEERELGESNFGLAIGSLVPLRKEPNKIAQIISIVKAVVSAIPEAYKAQIPVHVFGATGLLVPFLAYAGVDTFDSSTFIQEARVLKYLLPQTFQRRNIMEMSPQDIVCRCPICQNINLKELQSSLVSETVRQRLPSGHFKSKYYADIALHNFELDLGVLKETRARIAAESLDEYILKIAKEIPRMQNTLSALTAGDHELKRKASRSIQSLPSQLTIVHESPAHYVSLSHTPQDFDVNSNGYKPADKKPILLIIPCSREKPYSASHSHRHLSVYLEKSIPGWYRQIDKVTLSGLYGPVPYIYESHPAIMEYDFRLTTNNRQQIKLCAERLAIFLQQQGDYYEHCIAYSTSNAYRTVFEYAARQYNRLEIFPKKPKTRTLREFFRIANITELIQYLQTVMSITVEQ